MHQKNEDSNNFQLPKVEQTPKIDPKDKKR